MYAIATLSLPLAPRSADNFPRQCFNFAPLFRTTRPPLFPFFFLRLPWLPRHVERDAVRMTKCWNYRSSNDIPSRFLLHRWKDVRNRWKPLKTVRNRFIRIALIFEAYTIVCCFRFSCWLVRPLPRQAISTYARANWKLNRSVYKFELILPPSFYFFPLQKKAKRATWLIRFGGDEEGRDFFPSPSLLGDEEILGVETRPRPGHEDEMIHHFANPLGTCQNPSSLRCADN